MFKIVELFFCYITMAGALTDHNPTTQNSINLSVSTISKAPHISPEIVNELKDFKNLIPTAVIDEIIAEHIFLDEKFRTAMHYLHSKEIKQLQQQLLEMSEILNILDYLHLITPNATVALAHDDTHGANDDSRENRIGTYTDSTSNTSQQESYTSTNNKEIYKRPIQIERTKDNNRKVWLGEDDIVVVLLEKADTHMEANKGRHQYHKYHGIVSNNYKHDNGDHPPLGTFTSFVEEVLEHLPHPQYQQMISNKCQKNVKFAEFYKALRSPQFKTIIQDTLQTPNIKKIVNTLGSHDIDVASLEPIAFQVIGWGPNV